MREIHRQVIPLVPASRNARDRQHWAARARELNDWRLFVQQCPLHMRQAVGTKRQVSITFRKRRGPASDPDNLIARAKVPLDAIVARKWLVDDAPEYLDLAVREEIGTRAETEIVVGDILGEMAAA